MLSLFAESNEEEQVTHLFYIQKIKLIFDYVNEFEELFSQVSGIDEKNMVKVFYNIVKPKMKEVIGLKQS